MTRHAKAIAVCYPEAADKAATSRINLLALACAVAATLACGAAFAQPAQLAASQPAPGAASAAPSPRALAAMRAVQPQRLPSEQELAAHIQRTKVKVLDPLDENKDDKVTLEELQGMAKSIAPKLDVNKDGSLTRDEVVPKGPVDMQKNDAVSVQREFMVRMMAFQGMHDKPAFKVADIAGEAPRAFAAMDVNKDGVLNVKDIADHTYKSLERAKARIKMAKKMQEAQQNKEPQLPEYGIAPGVMPGIAPGILPGFMPGVEFIKRGAR